MQFNIQQKSARLPKDVIETLLQKPQFGRVFSEHIAYIAYSAETGWGVPKILPFEDVPINWANSTLHYAQEIFEGLKVYRNQNRQILLFRPEENAKRFQHSAYRMAMPILPEELFIASLETLLKVDQDWVSQDPKIGLYLRPFMFSADNFLGAEVASHYHFCVIASPMDSYFSNANSGITLWVEDEYSRAGPGGTGSVKCGGNYAASFLGLQRAHQQGCQQALYLDAVEHKWIEELGGMNIFFVTDKNHLITPLLNGHILPGITRDSIITLAKSFGYHVEEQLYAFPQLIEDVKAGKVVEAFACGTAASIAPISQIKHRAGIVKFENRPASESITQQIKAVLVGIQTGRHEDRYKWTRPLSL